MIRVLPPEIASRIAAGEVVERPASVVKELVENALDAGARRVRVEVEDGGNKLIRVVDDGCGMSPDDLGRALLAHATSKIAAVEDLHKVATFGFRGEALASIASVSRMTVTSRPRGAALGSRVRSEGGILGDVEPAGAPAGTSIEVENLFYNVPARRHFLKQNRYELAQVVEVLTRLALPDPDWSLELVSDGKPVLVASRGQDPRNRLADLFGSSLAGELVEVSGVRGSNRLRGFVGPPALVRPSGRYQHLFVNGRPIKDKKLSFAIVESYRGLIMPRDYPVAFLNIAVDPAMVDVNVHPAKTEVRFRDPDALFGLILRTIREAIEGVHQVAEAAPWAEASGSGAAAPITARESAATMPLAFEAGSGLAGRGTGTPAAPNRAATVAAPRFLQAHRSYIVVEDPAGIRIVDQHALHERKLFDELLARCARSEGEDQLLLIPFAADLGAADRELVLGAASELRRLGLQVEPFGKSAVALRSVPMVLRDASTEQVFFGTIEALRASGGVTERAVIEDVVAHLACRAAVKFNDALPDAEIRALLLYEQAHPEARNCPHGRTTSMLLSMRELETRFQRKK
jgi:DNA mismatch repair protein MutL